MQNQSLTIDNENTKSNSNIINDNYLKSLDDNLDSISNVIAKQ